VIYQHGTYGDFVSEPVLRVTQASRCAMRVGLRPTVMWRGQQRRGDAVGFVLIADGRYVAVTRDVHEAVCFVAGVRA
jgi:hypothetical protein